MKRLVCMLLGHNWQSRTVLQLPWVSCTMNICTRCNTGKKEFLTARALAQIGADHDR